MQQIHVWKETLISSVVFKTSAVICKLTPLRTELLRHHQRFTLAFTAHYSQLNGIQNHSEELMKKLR